MNSKELADKAEELGITGPDGLKWRERALLAEEKIKDAEGRNSLTDMKKYYRIEPSFKDGLYFPETTRFEVIDDEGRTYVKYDCEVKLAFQDDGQTIKMFVSKNKEDRKNS